jgi:hypothetical protein
MGLWIFFQKTFQLQHQGINVEEQEMLDFFLLEEEMIL